MIFSESMRWQTFTASIWRTNIFWSYSTCKLTTVFFRLTRTPIITRMFQFCRSADNGLHSFPCSNCTVQDNSGQTPHPTPTHHAHTHTPLFFGPEGGCVGVITKGGVCGVRFGGGVLKWTFSDFQRWKNFGNLRWKSGYFWWKTILFTCKMYVFCCFKYMKTWKHHVQKYTRRKMHDTSEMAKIQK